MMGERQLESCLRGEEGLFGEVGESEKEVWSSKSKLQRVMGNQDWGEKRVGKN